MKFAKELDEELVPEWRNAYFNYRLGKKKIKAVGRALRNVNQSPRAPRIRPTWAQRIPSHLAATRASPQHGYVHPHLETTRAKAGAEGLPEALGGKTSNRSPGIDKSGRPSTIRNLTSPAIPVPERKPLRSSNEHSRNSPLNYGSVGAATPPPYTTPIREMPSLELPDPAITADGDHEVQRHIQHHQRQRADHHGSSGHHGSSEHHGSSSHDHALSGRIFRPRRTVSTPHTSTPNSHSISIRRMFSSSPGTGDEPIQLAAYRELDEKQDDFFGFLDAELRKIEAFYKCREDEATARLELLKDQLHEMSNRRSAELAAADVQSGTKHPSRPMDKNLDRIPYISSLLKPIENLFAKKPHPSDATKAMSHQDSPHNYMSRQDTERDYTRRFDPERNVSHRSAKRKLKTALIELYRSLELLKTYAIQNRTAFRKINKKYDKVLTARPAGRYMSEKVNNAWFVESEVVDGHIVAVEDLYARYFERGNHKLAVVKLRGKLSRTVDFSPSSFRNGLLLAGGLVFGIEGLVSAVDLLWSPVPLRAERTSFLLQIYGGYFLALLLFLLFLVNCRIWSAAKINYVFIFEFDTRHTLDWRQIAELPCFFLFLLGLILWLNFRRYDDNTFTLWPAILVGITLAFMCFPAPVLYHRSRQWWAYSNWRLLLAGLYPVEFRDFFLGDMYCSQTYAMGNIELFFCLYSHYWTGMDQCNSSHSRLLGFLTTLPGIWRGLQCLRRYYDSRNSFPHLVNCGKYAFNVVYYLTLSLYRFSKTPEQRALFITCALINALYCSVWDVAMDWSLGNPFAKYPLLRNTLAFRRVWVYYVVMVLDPILRQQWVFYAIFTDDVQHSAVLSFAIGLAEVFRRGIWSVFRVENEHCTNVGRFRASRDVPLPYSTPSSPALTSPDQNTPETAACSTASADLERQHTSSTSARQRRGRMSPSTPLARAVHRVGSVMATAHTQDFQRRKQYGFDGESVAMGEARDDGSSDDEDDDEEAANLSVRGEAGRAPRSQE